MNSPDFLHNLEDPASWPLFTVRPVPVPTVVFPPIPSLPKTVIVTGHSHGGTSAIAAILDSLGIPMGNIDKGIYEGLWENPDLLTEYFLNHGPNHVQDAVEQQNSQHDIWGWKNPLPNLFSPFPDNVRNPHIVFVTRDPFAIEQMHQYTINSASPPTSNMLTPKSCNPELLWSNCVTIANHYAMIWEELCKRRLPTLAISYERFQTSPALAVLGIATFLSIDPTPDKVSIALTRISPGGYHVPPSRWLSHLIEHTNPPVNSQHPTVVAIKRFLEQIT